MTGTILDIINHQNGLKKILLVVVSILVAFFFFFVVNVYVIVVFFAVVISVRQTMTIMYVLQRHRRLPIDRIIARRIIIGAGSVTITVVTLLYLKSQFDRSNARAVTMPYTIIFSWSLHSSLKLPLLVASQRPTSALHRIIRSARTVVDANNPYRNPSLFHLPAELRFVAASARVQPLVTLVA